MIIENESNTEKKNFKELLEELIFFCEQQGEDTPQYKKMVDLKKNMQSKKNIKVVEFNKLNSTTIDMKAKLKHLRYSNEDMKSMIKDSLK